MAGLPLPLGFRSRRTTYTFVTLPTEEVKTHSFQAADTQTQDKRNSQLWSASMAWQSAVACELRPREAKVELVLEVKVALKASSSYAF